MPGEWREKFTGESASIILLRSVTPDLILRWNFDVSVQDFLFQNVRMMDGEWSGFQFSWVSFAWLLCVGEFSNVFSFVFH